MVFVTVIIMKYCNAAVKNEKLKKQCEAKNRRIHKRI